MIQCKRCKKQYIGETKGTLRERCKEHRQATNNPLHAIQLLGHACKQATDLPAASCDS